MNVFSTTMQATVRVPQDGFTQDELKAHLRASKIPADARLIPTIVREVDISESTYEARLREGLGEEKGQTEVAFLAEWTQ